MRKERKPIGRWIGEALLIFLSVIGAFFVDNRREVRSQNIEYLRHLKDFKRDLLNNQGAFNYELNDNYNPVDGQGYIKGSIRKYMFFDSLFRSKTRASADSIMKLINDGAIYGVTPWIFESPQYAILTSDFYSFIKNDTLKSRLALHHRAHESRVNVKRAINSMVRKFESIEDELDWEAGASLGNRSVLFRNTTINTITRLGENYEFLKSMTEQARSRDSLVLIQIDHELELWGELDN